MLPTRRKRIFGIVLFSANLSCGILGPDDLTVRVLNRVRDGRGPSAEVVTAGAAVGSIVINGSFFTPNDCGGIDGFLERNHNVIVVQLNPNDHGCGSTQTGATAFLQYEATISDLASGSYGLRVIHDNRGTFQMEGRTVLDESVVVP